MSDPHPDESLQPEGTDPRADRLALILRRLRRASPRDQRELTGGLAENDRPHRLRCLGPSASLGDPTRFETDQLDGAAHRGLNARRTWQGRAWVLALTVVSAGVLAQTPGADPVAPAEVPPSAPAELLPLPPAQTTAPADAASGDLWRMTRDTAGDWWQRSRDLAGQAVTDAQGMLTDSPDFGRVWEQVVPTLNETLDLEERQDQLPESAWFGADQASNRSRIDGLLDDAVDILSTSPVQQFRDRIRAINGEIDRDRAQIADYRQRRVSAPADGTLVRSVADYDRLIAERQEHIEQLTKQQGLVRKEFAAAVRALGVELSDEQVEFLLSTVVGDSMVDLGVLFDNVKSVTAQLERLVAESGEDLASARRYYGMYVLLLRALHRMHVRIEESIGEDYVPRIVDIITRTQSLMAETRRLQRDSPAKRDLLAANLAAQQLTIEAAAVYRSYLEQQARQVSLARRELDKDIAAAWNTYETVRVGGELVGLVRSSQQLLEGLMERQVPALRPFENLEMRREFEKLTLQLRAANAR